MPIISLELLAGLIERGDINIPDTALTTEQEIERSEIENKVYEKFTTVGEKEDIALGNAKLFGQFFSRYGARNEETKKKFYEWFNKFEVRYDVTPKELKEQLKQEALYQSAMYKSPLENFKDFYNQVFEKENAKTKSKKSYFDFNNGKVSVRIPHDTIVHDENKHKLSADEWEEILNNINKPVNVAVSSKPRFNGQPILLKVVGENQTYGAVVEFFENKQPIITTAFTDDEANIDKWLNKNRSAQAKNTSSVTSKGMLLSQDLNSIMTYLKENFNPSLKNNKELPKNTEQTIGKALYTINKEAKKIRDIRENLKEFLFYQVDLEKSTLEYLKEKYPDVNFDSQKGAVYIDETDTTYTAEELDKYIDELRYKISRLNDGIEDAKINNEDTTELEDDYEFNKSELDYVKEELQKLNEVNLHEILKDSQEEINKLYNLKQKILNKFNNRKQGQHKFNDGSARNLYEIGGFTFHGEDISDSLSQGEYDKLEQLDNISSENKLSDNDKLTSNDAINLLNNYLNKDNVLFQSAYHGTPHRFDKFSTEHIGSGEGAQAHGWGLYFAGNKEVSEGYRRTLAQSLKNAKYDGVPLSKTELTKLHSAISEKLYLKGKDEALKELELLRKQSEKK